MEKTKSKYIIFPAIMIAITIFSFFYPYFNSYIKYNSIEIMEMIDITGYTKIFSITFLVINIIVLSICVLEGKKGEERGYNYSLNKIFAIIFIILSISNILAFVLIRNKEEKLAKEIQDIADMVFSEDPEDNVYYIGSDNKKRNKSQKSNNVEKIQELKQNDKYYARKMQICREIKEEPSKLKRYLVALIYCNLYNETATTTYEIKPSDSEIYYAIYSVAILIDLACSIFYIKGMNDKGIEEKTGILNN